jgi:hypothetical protein
MKSEQIPLTPVTINKCIYCSSTNIVHHIEIGQTAEEGRIGLTYKTRFIVQGTERLFADLCDDCGSVVRIFVENIRKKWVTK